MGSLAERIANAFVANTLTQYVGCFIISMIPLIELRGAIPIAHWLTLTRELQTQKDELIQLQTLLQKLRRPSDQLQQELQRVKEQLAKSQQELQNARNSLTDASSALAGSKTSLQTLRQSIDKERRVHRRKIWQNRFWFLISGLAAGFAVAK